MRDWTASRCTVYVDAMATMTSVSSSRTCTVRPRAARAPLVVFIIALIDGDWNARVLANYYYGPAAFVGLKSEITHVIGFTPRSHLAAGWRVNHTHMHDRMNACGGIAYPCIYWQTCSCVINCSTLHLYIDLLLTHEISSRWDAASSAHVPRPCIRPIHEDRENALQQYVCLLGPH